MAKAVTEIAIGAAAIGAAIAIPGGGIAIGTLMISHAAAVGALVSLSGSMIMSGIADALKKNQGGLAVAVTTPIGAHGYVYGEQKVGGVEIFRQSNNSQGTSNNKELHRVYVLACHPCNLTSWQLRIDGRQVLVRPSSTGAGWDSYPPAQISAGISSMTRDANGVVTVHLSADVPGQDGNSIQITYANDNTFNGVWIVTQPNKTDPRTYTFICGGVPTTTSGGQFSTLYSNYKDKIHIELLDGTHAATFPGLLASNTSWKASDKGLGRTLAYVRMGYDDSVFPSSIPNVSFVIRGKKDILDPRTGTRIYTNNAALCIADYLAMPATKGGFGLTIGTDIPTAQLSAAANICDELVPLAAGGTVKRYTCNTFFQLNATRGSILQQMLTSCAGRISYQGGQFSIFPGAWVGPTLQLSEADLIGPIEWRPRHSIRDTCNAIKGTYVSPENAYQQADVPPYMQNYQRHYGAITDPGQGDRWLVEDGLERIFKDANFPCTDNAATAQRLAKIALMRIRNQGRGTLRCNMRAYQAVALDVIQLTHARYGWTNKNLEVLADRLVVDKTKGGAPVLAVELDVAETDSTGFDWATTEELSPQGFTQPVAPGAQIAQPPENVTLYSGPGATISGVTYPSTVTVGADGRVSNALYCAWITPNDAYVIAGGHIEVQWQPSGAAAFLPFGKFDPSVNSCFITPVSDGAQYNVRVRAVNCIAVPSIWITVGPATVSSAYSTVSYSGVPVAPAGTLSAQGLADGSAQISISAFTPPFGGACTPSPNLLTGLNQAQLYYVYYIDAAMTGGTITPIATQNKGDFSNKTGYFLIGSITTPTYTPRYQPTSYHDTGSSTTTTPAAAYDNNTTTTAIVGASLWSVIAGIGPPPNPQYYYQTATGDCIFSGFAAVAAGAALTLHVVASTTDANLPAAASWYGNIVVHVGGTNTTLATFSATTAQTDYTMTIAAGTVLSTISIEIYVNINAPTPGQTQYTGTASVRPFEIYIQ